jgi:hypothetical protein
MWYLRWRSKGSWIMWTETHTCNDFPASWIKKQLFHSFTEPELSDCVAFLEELSVEYWLHDTKSVLNHTATLYTLHQLYNFCYVGFFYLHYFSPSFSGNKQMISDCSWVMLSIDSLHFSCFYIQFLYFFMMPIIPNLYLSAGTASYPVACILFFAHSSVLKINLNLLTHTFFNFSHFMFCIMIFSTSK